MKTRPACKHGKYCLLSVAVPFGYHRCHGFMAALLVVWQMKFWSLLVFCKKREQPQQGLARSSDTSISKDSTRVSLVDCLFCPFLGEVEPIRL